MRIGAVPDFCSGSEAGTAVEHGAGGLSKTQRTIQPTVRRFSMPANRAIGWPRHQPHIESQLVRRPTSPTRHRRDPTTIQGERNSGDRPDTSWLRASRRRTVEAFLQDRRLATPRMSSTFDLGPCPPQG